MLLEQVGDGVGAGDHHGADESELVFRLERISRQVILRQQSRYLVLEVGERLLGALGDDGAVGRSSLATEVVIVDHDDERALGVGSHRRLLRIQSTTAGGALILGLSAFGAELEGPAAGHGATAATVTDVGDEHVALAFVTEHCRFPRCWLIGVADLGDSQQ